MSNVTLSLVLAYILMGISQVTEDMTADPIRKPMWAFRPSFGKMLLVGITWFTRPFLDVAYSQQVARDIAFGILKLMTCFALLTARPLRPPQQRAKVDKCDICGAAKIRR